MFYRNPPVEELFPVFVKQTFPTCGNNHHHKSICDSMHEDSDAIHEGLQAFLKASPYIVWREHDFYLGLHYGCSNTDPDGLKYEGPPVSWFKVSDGIVVYDASKYLDDRDQTEHSARENAKRLYANLCAQKLVEGEGPSIDRLLMVRSHMLAKRIQETLRIEPEELAAMEAARERARLKFQQEQANGEDSSDWTSEDESHELVLPELLDSDEKVYDGDDKYECQICFEDRERRFIFNCRHGGMCAVCIHKSVADEATLRCHRCRAVVTKVE